MEYFVTRRNPNFLFLVLFFTSARAIQNYTDVMDVESIFEINPTNPELIRIAKNLLMVKFEMNLLNFSIDTAESMTFCQKVYAIKAKLLKLRENIADQKDKKEHAIYNMSVYNLTMFYDYLCGQMIELKKKIKIFEKNCSASAVVKAVIYKKFEEAEDILTLMESESPISWIVQKVYNSDANNLEILLNFTESLSSIDLSISIMSATYKEIKANGHLDIFRVIDLLQILQSDIFNQTYFNPMQHPNAVILHDDIVALLKKNSTDMMVTEMLSHTFIFEKNNLDFLSELYNFSNKLSTEIIFKVIDRVHGNISNKEILAIIFSQCYYPLALDALSYMYQKLKALNQLETGVLKVAQYIFLALWNMKYFEEGLVEKPHHDLINIWNDLPSSVSNLLFAEKFCLRNLMMSEYLYAATDFYNSNGTRRNIFTRPPKKEQSQGIWQFESPLFSEYFYLFNGKYTNEYMYASEYEVGIKSIYNHDFTGTSEEIVDNNNIAWNIEVVRGHLRLINVFNNQLLCVGSNRYEDDKRYVMTLQKDSYKENLKCMWDVEVC